VTTPANTLGRLAEASTDNCFGVLQTDTWFSYDKDGNITDRWERTPSSGTYYHTVATFYGNGVVNTLKIANPSSYTQTYGLDGEGRPNSLTSSAGPNQVIVSGVTYDAASQPTNIMIGTGTDYDAYAYDSNTGRMTNWTFQVGTNLAQENATLTWNPIGSLEYVAITDGFNSGGTQTCSFGSSSTMGYDDLNRLVYDNCGSGYWGQSYSYDNYDNVSKTILSGRIGISFSPGYNTGSGCSPCNNHYISSFRTTYDSNGNILYDASSTNTYAWNEFSKMKSVNVTGTNCATSGECLVYDAFGRLVEIDSGSTYTELLYSQLGKAVYLNGSTIKYAYWPTPGGGTLLQNPGSFYYEHKDWLGNARISSSVANEGIIDDRAFAPYGEIYATFGSTAQNENIFTGDTQDIVFGMYDTPNRELVANQGRWMSPDPAQSGWNPYAYPTNPNSQSDPSGLGACSGRGCLFAGGGGKSPLASNGEGNSGGGDDSYDFSLITVTVAADSGASAPGTNTSSSGGLQTILNGIPAFGAWFGQTTASALLQELLDPAEDPNNPNKPSDEDNDSETQWGQALVPLKPGEFVWPSTGWQYNMVNPGPLDPKIAGTYAGGQYSMGAVGEGGLGIESAAYRVSDNPDPTAQGSNGTFYAMTPQVGGLQTAIDYAINPNWGAAGTPGGNPNSNGLGLSNVGCVYFQPGTIYFIGPTASQGGAWVGGGIQIYVPPGQPAPHI